MNSLPNPEISGKTKAAKEIQAHLASGNIGHAAEVALENAHFWPEDTRLCLLAMKALYRASDHEAACNAADILLGKNNADAEQILAAVAVYLGAGQASKARAVTIGLMDRGLWGRAPHWGNIIPAAAFCDSFVERD